jgi:phytoene/squalene synthetase
MSAKADFYQSHLDRVSRSFAFCIARLGSPLREQVGLSYLICRVLDTVEDANWAKKSQQAEQFQRFERLLVSPFSDAEFMQWRNDFPAGLPEGECLLLDDAAQILRDFQALPEQARNAIEEPVLSMSRGMHHFSLAKNQNELRLNNLREVNQYCFFVAGVVGEILTRLVAITVGKEKVDPAELVDAFHFGLFLQKINILKDQRSDEEQGRAIPKTLLGFRLFCSWSLFLGLASLPWIQQNWEENDLSKIPREQTQTLLKEIEAIVGDDLRLKQMFEFLFSMSGAGETPFSGATNPSVLTLGDSFPNLYRGLLSDNELRQFGLV